MRPLLNTIRRLDFLAPVIVPILAVLAALTVAGILLLVLNVDPIQVLEHLERAPWMSYAEARKGPLAFYNDIFYANLARMA